MWLSDDPVADFEAYDREQAKRLSERPVCDNCDQPIQDTHYYSINGECICPDCLENYFREEID